MKPSTWLDRNRPIEQITWAPSQPMLIKNRVVAEGGFTPQEGYTCFNLYKPPTIVAGNAGEAGPWLKLVRRVYPEAANHIIRWFAQRVQAPQTKINHALVLGGAMGIGKDTIFEPVKRAVGPWNCHEISPQHVMGTFNGFLKSVILRVSEARDLGDVNRFQFYDHMKAITAAPPDVLRVNEKHLREYSVLNCCGIIITTNHKADGIYLPSDDRRHYVAWSNLTKDDFTQDYWDQIWTWYDADGARHVAAYLKSVDLSDFNPKAPPPKTVAFWEIVNASRAPEDAELSDVLDLLGQPDAVTLASIIASANADFAMWLGERKNQRQIPFRFEQCGYVPVHNDASKQGLWSINGKRQRVYAKATLSLRDQIVAVKKLVNEKEATNAFR
jgi:hypothetical protein